MTDWKADLIKIFAVITAMPRWVGALLAAEGFLLPHEWLVWWIPLSALTSAGMAIVEGFAFSYVFEAWRNQRDKSGNNLIWLAMGSATLFVGVLAPYIAAQVLGVRLAEVLRSGWALGLWSVAVGASTIAIVASVGYAQKQKAQPTAKHETQPIAQQPEPAQQTQQEAQPIAQADTRDRVLALHHDNPAMKHEEIAQAVGVSRQRVGAIIRQNGYQK